MSEPEYCPKEWKKDGVIHSCYLDKGHKGDCVCGYCETEPSEHPKDNGKA